jgi:apolipoprotein N-acyltransferase
VPFLEKFADRLRALTAKRRFFAAIAAGAFGALAFPPVYLFPALLVSYAVLIALLGGAASNARRGRAFAKIGWAYGFGFFFVGLHWIGYPFFVNAEEHAWLMPFAIILMPAGLALFFAAAASLCGVLWRQGPQRVLLFTFAFAAFEWLRGHILTGFPWNIPGYAWGASTALLQSVSVIGIYGLSALTILFGASLVLLASRGRGAWLPYGMAALFVALWAGGSVRLANATDETVPGVQLRIVQPATHQNEKYRPEFVQRNWDRLMDLSYAPAEIEPTHIIWPEAAPPVLLAQDENALGQIADLLGNDRVLLTGALRREQAGGVAHTYNSLYVIGAGGRILSTYDKFHLVPFGEYLPFEDRFNALGITAIANVVSSLSSGAGPQTLDVPRAPPAGPLICYEVVFPGEVIGEERPGWFVNVTDDSWFGPSAGPAQHLLIARVRAIEEGLPIVRAANAGISVIVDGYGRILNELDLNVRGYIDGPLPAALSPPLYTRFGELIFFIVIAAALGASYIRVWQTHA